MKFNLSEIKNLIKQSYKMGDIGHQLMDDYYNWYEELVGHSNEYYKLFYLISKQFKPKFVVELGAYRAGAAGHFAIGNPGATVATIDIHKDMPQQEFDKKACEEAMRVIPNLFYINKWTVDFMGGLCAIDDIKAYNKSIDILYIDAWHDPKHIRREWELYSPLLSDKALVICDDLADGGYGPFLGMEAWWEQFKYEKFRDTGVHGGIPMGFMKFERQ